MYPYLLRHLTITRSYHVWAADTTYIPMRRGFVYLFAVLDWASCRVFAWRRVQHAGDFCIVTVQEALCGGTTCWWNGSGEASNMRRCFCGPMTASTQLT